MLQSFLETPNLQGLGYLDSPGKGIHTPKTLPGTVESMDILGSHQKIQIPRMEGFLYLIRLISLFHTAKTQVGPTAILGTWNFWWLGWDMIVFLGSVCQWGVSWKTSNGWVFCAKLGGRAQLSDEIPFSFCIGVWLVNQQPPNATPPRNIALLMAYWLLVSLYKAFHTLISGGLGWLGMIVGNPRDWDLDSIPRYDFFSEIFDEAQVEKIFTKECFRVFHSYKIASHI